MKTIQWGRSDQMGLEAVLWLVPVAGAVSLVVRVVHAGRDQAIRLPTTLPDSILPPRDGLTGPYEGTVVLADPTASQHLVHLLPHLVGVLLAVAVAGLLLGAVRDLGAGDPFTPSSARRLQALAVVVVFGGLLVQVVAEAARDHLVHQVTGLGDLPRVFELSFWPVAAALVIAFVSEVFSRGVALREDVEGLV